MEYNFVYVLNYVFAIAWVLSMAYALIKLRNMEMNSTARAVWVAILVLVPFIGVIAFLLTTNRQEA
jgi:hypothetical protein